LVVLLTSNMAEVLGGVLVADIPTCEKEGMLKNKQKMIANVLVFIML
jgi:hypothetical protein